MKRRSRKAEKSPLDDFIISLVNTSEFPYNYSPVLGITISVLLLWIGERGKDYFMPLGLCMLAFPFIDETIQLFTPDRGAMISDMWIDIGGFALGSVIVLLINRTVHAKRNKRKLKDLAR